LLSFKEFETKPELRWQHAWLLGIPIGAVLGGISGLVGIGGGIFLLPILSFLGWAHAKEGAAAASFFILVNSLSGLIGQFSKSDAFIGAVEIAPLALAVFVGGQIGSRVGSGKLPKIVMQRIAGFLIFAVSMRMLWRLVITQ